MNFVDISGGSEITKYGLIFTGQCAIYDSKVSIKNSNFLYSKGDDGLNVKHSSVDISDSFFGYNRADQVDLDFCTGLISNCIYKPSLSDPNGDGLDISGSEILVKKSVKNINKLTINEKISAAEEAKKTPDKKKK